MCVARHVDWPGCGSDRGDGNFLGLRQMLRTSKDFCWSTILGQSLHALFVKWDLLVDRAHFAPRLDESHVILPIHY